MPIRINRAALYDPIALAEIMAQGYRIKVAPLGYLIYLHDDFVAGYYSSAPLPLAELWAGALARARQHIERGRR